MTESFTLHTAGLRSALQTARREHFRVFWVVGGTASDRTALIRAVADGEDGAVLDVGRLLSAALIEIPSSHRAVSVDDAFSDMLPSGVRMSFVSITWKFCSKRASCFTRLIW